MPPILPNIMGRGCMRYQYIKFEPTPTLRYPNSNMKMRSFSSPSHDLCFCVCLRNQRACRNGFVASEPKTAAMNSVPLTPRYSTIILPVMLMVWCMIIMTPEDRKIKVHYTWYYTHIYVPLVLFFFLISCIAKKLNLTNL